MTEADTCRTYVVPKLHSAGWNDEQIREQVTFTDGRIIPVGAGHTRKEKKRADYVLRNRPDFPLTDGLPTKVNELRCLRAATQKELDALMPSTRSVAKAFAVELRRNHP